MKKFKEFMKKYFNQKVRNIISIFIIIFGITFMYIYSFKSPTYINKIIATNIYKEPANSAFTDQNFYNCVIDAYNVENDANKGYTDSLTDNELKKITRLNCDGYKKSDEEKIINTSGLEKLTELKFFDVTNNKLMSLDVSNNTTLTYLWISDNQLTSLDVSKNTALKSLLVSDNQLISLDVSKNTALTELSAENIQLISLDVSKNVSLTSLNVANTQLTSLDVSQNTALTYLNVSGNQLTSLDVSKNIALIELWGKANQLTSLDVSQNTALNYLNVSDNQLISLDVGQNTALTDLWAPGNQLTTLDVSKNTALISLNVSSNQLTSLDVSKNTALTKLNVSSNQLTSLDVSKNTALITLKVPGNQLTSLNVSQNTTLIELDVTINQLTSLDLSKNTSLTVLWTYKNQFELFKKIYLGEIVDFDSSMIKFSNPDSTTYKNIRSKDVSIVKITDDNKIEGIAKGNSKVEGSVGNSEISSVSLSVYNNISVIEMTSEKYLINNDKGYIFTYSDIDGDTIKSNLSVSDSEVDIVISDNNLKLMDGDNVIKEFKIINVVSDKVNLDSEFITIDNVNDITCNNCKVNIDNTGLVISDNDGNEIYTYKILNVASDIYDIIDDKIIVFNDYDDNSTIINNIKSNYGSVNITNDKKVQLVYNDQVIKEYGLVGFTSDKYNLDSSLIIASDEEVINNITCYNCDMEIVDSKLLIKYGDNIIREYTLLTINSEYKIIKDTILVGNDYDDNDLIISKISVSYGSISISDDKKLVISDGDTVLKEYRLSDEYIDIVDYEMNDNELVVSRIDIGTSIDIFNGKIDANIAQGYEIFDKDDNAIGDRVLRTGDKLRVRFSIEPIDYILSVKGDVLGTGDPGVEDGKLIAKHIIDGNVINGGEYLLAADYDGDGNIKMNDVVRMLKERQ